MNLKRALAVIVFLFCARAAEGQVLISILLGDKLNTGKIEFGLDGGFNLASMSGSDQSGNRPFFNLGFYFDIKLKKPQWMLHTGVIVKSSMGADGLPVYPLGDENLDDAFSGGSVKRELSYFNVPVMIKYMGRSRFYAEAGIQLGLLYNAAEVFTNEIMEEDLTYKVNVKDRYYRLDAGVVAGIGYRLPFGYGMNIGLRYYYGLADVAIDDSGPSQSNRSLYVTVGIPIGAGKAAKAAEK
jgi:hypothetical protein